MNDEVDDAGGPHIDRRGLLKKAGAAGALGLAVPITFDSFFSPAAACSVDGLLAEQRGILESTTNAATAYNIPVAATTAGSMLVIAFTIVWDDNAGGAALGTADVAGSGGAIEDPITQVMERFHDTSNLFNGDYYLGVIVGSATGTAGTVTVTFPAPGGYTFTALAIEVFDAVTPVPSPTVGVIGLLSTGNSSSASAALGGLASPGAAQLVFFGSESATIYTPDTAEFSSVGQARQTDLLLGFFDTSVSTHVMFGNVAQAGAVTSLLDATTNWGAIAMEVLC